MLNKIRAFAKASNTFFGLLSGFGILFMGLILTYEVIMRGFFHSPTVWVMNVSIYIFIWCMLIGSAYTLMLGKHVRIDLIFDKFPKKMQLYVDVITSIMGVIFCVIVVKQGWSMVATSIRLHRLTDNLLHIPVWWTQIPLVIGFVLLALQFTLIVVDRVAEICSPKEADGKEVTSHD